jgi:ferredoxin
MEGASQSGIERFSEDNFIMGKKVTLETEECIACESCVELCPDVFEFDEEAGKAEVKSQRSLTPKTYFGFPLGLP